MSKSIIINSIILSLGILIGRISGYIREIIIATKYGVTGHADNVLLMLAVPDLLNNLLASGAVVGVLIPMLNSHNDKIEEMLSEFTKKLFYIALIFYFTTIIVLFFMYDFYLFSLLSISLLSVFPNIFTFIMTSFLQFKKRFKKQSLNSLIFNIVIIFFLLINSKTFIFAFGVIIASIIRMLWIYSDLEHTNVILKSFFKKNRLSLLKYKTLIFVIFANGLIFINPMIDKMFAVYLKTGSVAILSYAEKIYLFPVSVFLTTYAVAMFPDLSRLVSEKKKDKAFFILKKAIFINIVFSLIIGVILYLFSYDIVNLFFRIANFQKTTLADISIVLNGYIVSLVLSGTNSILLNLIFSYKWYESLILYSIVILLCNVILDLIVVKLGLNVEYIAYATSFTSILSVISLSVLYKIRIKRV